MVKPGERYEVKYTPKELKYKLFGKKSCPLCKGRMALSREKEFSGKSRGMSMSRGRSLGKETDVYQVTEYYCCEQCGKRFTIAELVEKEQVR
jgi:uncharacterized protein YbaR (Trm112 family)